MTAPIFAHQQSGSAYLVQREAESSKLSHGRSDPSNTGSAILGDAPGLGKTRTALLACRESDKRPVVICPAIVKSHWLREAALMEVRPHRVLSYDELVRGGDGFRGELVSRYADSDGVLLVDEFHYCKNQSQRAKAIFGKNGLAQWFTTWPLSGTPMPRQPEELWNVLSCIAPGLVLRYGFKTRAQWQEHFCQMRGSLVRGVWREKAVGVKNAELLKTMLAQVMLRRTLDEVGLDVPRIFWQALELDSEAVLTPDLFNGSEEQVVSMVMGRVPKSAHVATLRRRIGEAKAGAVVKHVQAALDGGEEKIVLFAHHTSVLDALGAGLRDYGVALIDGGVSPRGRDIAVDRFRKDPMTRIFLGQNIACQTGMDGLQSVASRAILVEPDWTPDVNLQLAYRVARIGSNASRCIAQMVTLAGTLDEAIVAQNLRETRMVSEVGL